MINALIAHFSGATEDLVNSLDGNPEGPNPKAL